MRSEDTTPRWLLAVVIGMGVMILAGTAGLVGVILHRASHGAHGSAAPVVAALPPLPGVAGAMLELSEPAGTRIMGVTRQTDDILVLQLSGGGADRLVFWNRVTGRFVGGIRLSQ